MRRSILLAAIVASISASPAFADAAASFKAGRWSQAVTEGRAEGTAQSYVLAGRATLAIAGYQERNKDAAKAAIAAAIADFDKAIAKAPNNLEARIERAIATGYRAKLDRSPGEGKDARDQMQAVLAKDPNFALANAALGAWHGGAVATIGNFLASTLLGANRKDMDRYLRLAMARQPQDIIHPVTYAFTLLDIGADTAPQATTLLRTAVSLPVRDAYDGINHKAAKDVLALLEAKDVKGARALVKKLEPFNNVG